MRRLSLVSHLTSCTFSCGFSDILLHPPCPRPARRCALARAVRCCALARAAARVSLVHGCAHDVRSDGACGVWAGLRAARGARRRGRRRPERREALDYSLYRTSKCPLRCLCASPLVAHCTPAADTHETSHMLRFMVMHCLRRTTHTLRTHTHTDLGQKTDYVTCHVTCRVCTCLFCKALHGVVRGEGDAAHSYRPVDAGLELAALTTCT